MYTHRQPISFWFVQMLLRVQVRCAMSCMFDTSSACATQPFLSLSFEHAEPLQEGCMACIGRMHGNYSVHESCMQEGCMVISVHDSKVPILSEEDGA